MNDSGVPISTSTSLTLLQGVRRRDPNAWARFSRLYGPEVYRWARQLGLQDSDAADVAQEVFLAVANNIDRFRRDRAGDSFRGWLWRITRNKTQDFHRRIATGPAAAGGTDAQRRLLSITDSPPDDTFEPESNGAARLSQRALEIIKSGFEQGTWQIFCWATIDGRSTADIAADMGMAKSAVRQAKCRVMKRLRQELEGLIG